MKAKQVALWVAFFCWSLILIYGTYHNTVVSAEVRAVENGGYEITYHNTGEIHYYERGDEK